jgi:riboflavin synthase
MFTGIVEKVVEVIGVDETSGGRRLRLGQRWGDELHGESVAINGCCLTVSELYDDGLSFDAIRETLDKTNLGRLRIGDGVHVERSLRAGDRLDGHLVQGHIDATAELIGRVANDEEWRLTLRPPAAMMPFVFPKGSVCLDGVSLTVASLDADTFDVALIPTTLDKTALARRAVGYAFNFEADVLAKGVVQTVSRMLADEAGGLSASRLQAMIRREPVAAGCKE